MRPAAIAWALIGLAYAAGAGWLLYDYYDEAAGLLRGRWLKDLAFLEAIWPGAHKAIKVSWLHDLRIVMIPVYAALGLWLAERVWNSVTSRLRRE